MHIGKSHASTREHAGMEPQLFIYMLDAVFPQEEQMVLYTTTILLLMEGSSILICT